MGTSGCWRGRVEDMLVPVELRRMKKEPGTTYGSKEGKETWKLIVPATMREEIMKEHHDSKGAGHFGVMKTLENLKASQYFGQK